MRYCKYCNQTKEFTEFSYSKRDGYNTRCKSCVHNDYLSKRDQYLERARIWKQENPEKRLENNRKWREENLEKARECNRLWAQRNKWSTHQVRASKRSARIDWDTELTNFVSSEAADLTRLRKSTTGVDWDIDHIIPFKHKTVCGLHVWNNLQVILATLNRSKGHRNDREYRWSENFQAG